METVLLTIFKYLLRLIYLPMKKLIRTEDKIVFLSRQSNEKSMDMKLLSRALEIEMPACRQVFRLKMIDPGLVSFVRYFFWILGDMVQLAGASVAICDTYSIPVSCLNHKKSLKIIQMWHAMGAVKKFGLQSLNKEEGRDADVSRIMQMHEHYDYVIAPSESMAKFYEEAFGVTRDQIYLCPLPRMDYLLHGPDRRADFLRLNPEYSGSRIVLYLPTFRDEEGVIMQSLADVFARYQQQDYEQDQPGMRLLISPHPLSKVRDQMQTFYNGNFTVEDLMRLADVIITDYSACLFEASVLGAVFGTRIYLYVPDYTAYEQNRGLNIDLKEELSACLFEDPEALYKAAAGGEYDHRQVEDFQKKYICDTQACTRKLAEFVSRITQE